MGSLRDPGPTEPIGAVIAVGVIGGLGYYIYRTKKGERGATARRGASASTSKEQSQTYTAIPLELLLDDATDNLESINRLNDILTLGSLAHIKIKVRRLLQGGIRQGFSSPKSRVVQSESSEIPHVVTFTGTLYKCDGCLNYKTFEICSHSLAAASDNNNLDGYIDNLLQHRRNKSANLTPVSTIDSCKNAGRKPGATVRKRPKKVDMLKPSLSLKEALQDIQPDLSLLTFNAQHQDGLKFRFNRVNLQIPPKPLLKNLYRPSVSLISVEISESALAAL